MPAFSGINTAKELREVDKNIHIVFCSSSQDYALQGYSVQASNYLVKPVTKDSLVPAVDNILRKINTTKAEKILLPTQQGSRLVSPWDISYITPDNNYCHIHIRSDKVAPIIACRLSFAQLVANLAHHRNFVVIGRSALLNLDYVVGMEQEHFILDTGVKIAIPRRKKNVE